VRGDCTVIDHHWLSFPLGRLNKWNLRRKNDKVVIIVDVREEKHAGN
jgi:hypothetical protein